ncbi:MAG: uracil-DNA glycosylase [Verrucomicrobia bacterium]|nr:uracil-DNA glycosylase [Verrucomicrobiota bacterium]
MSSAYRKLLDATIHHLEILRDQGHRFVSVSSEALAALESSAPRAASSRKVPAVSQPTPATGLADKPHQEQERVASHAGRPQEPTGTADDVLVGSPLSAAEKEAAMAALRARVLPCVKCAHLARSRRNVVFGVGNVHSPLLFVGEAPGADEDVQGEPFVGKAGQLLTKIIQTMGLDRDRVYIANILKCRPDTPGQTAGNRKPTPVEMTTCLPFLIEQIRIIQPKVIVALGATAVEGLFGKCDGITRLRGTWLNFRGVPVMPTYHPAYLLRNQALLEKRRVWEDMLQVMERLGMPISEKQRGFFLKATGA